jgi:hypothetical protein
MAHALVARQAEPQKTFARRLTLREALEAGPASTRLTFQGSPHWITAVLLRGADVFACPAGVKPPPAGTGGGTNYAVRWLSDLSPEMAAWAAAKRAMGTR